MTVSTVETRKTYNGNGVTDAFATPYFLADSDLVVYVDGVLQTITTDYTVTGAGVAGGGEVTFVTPPPVGTANVVILVDPALTQLTDWVENDRNGAEVKETAFDRLTIIAQRLADRISRAVQLSETDTATTLTVPELADRLSKFLAFDASGNLIAADGGTVGVPVSAYMATLLDDADVAAALTTLGIGVSSPTITATDSDLTITSEQFAAYDTLNLDLSAWTVARNVIVPAIGRNFTPRHNAGTYPATVKTAAGTGIAITSGNSAILVCDGVNVSYSCGSLPPFNSKTAAVSYITDHGIVNGQKYSITSSDGGAFVGKTGASAATYADDGGVYCGTQFIPTGGDGSEGLVRNDYITLTPEMFGAVGDGVTDDYATISAAVSLDKPITYTGSYRIGSNLTIPTTVATHLVSGASFSVDTGITLKTYGDVSAPFEYIFKGLGTVQGIREVYPEWFGAAGDGVTDDQPALQKCVTCIQDSFSSNGGKPLIKLGGFNYLVESPWIIYQTANVSISVEGAGALIGGTRIVTPVNYGYAAVVIEGSSDTLQRLVNFTISDFAIIQTTVGYAGGVGLQFNKTDGNFISGVHESVVKNIYIEGFHYGILAQRLRLVAFNQVSVWNDGIAAIANYCLQIRDIIGGTASYSGDLTFTQCQFVGLNANANSVGVALEATTSGSGISGIRFDKCIFYKAHNQLTMLAAADATLGDIWVTSCQFDGDQSIGVAITQEGAASTGYVADIQIKNCYFTAAAVNFVRLTAAKSGAINGINITANYGAGCTRAVVEAAYCNGITVNGNNWSGCAYTGDSAISFASCSQVVVNNNNFGQAGSALAGGFGYMIGFKTSGNYLTAIGNNSAGLFTIAAILDTTGAANKAIANNI